MKEKAIQGTIKKKKYIYKVTKIGQRRVKQYDFRKLWQSFLYQEQKNFARFSLHHSCLQNMYIQCKEHYWERGDGELNRACSREAT